MGVLITKGLLFGVYIRAPAFVKLPLREGLTAILHPATVDVCLALRVRKVEGVADEVIRQITVGPPSSPVAGIVGSGVVSDEQGPRNSKPIYR